jgi:hypothetical protein
MSLGFNRQRRREREVSILPVRVESQESEDLKWEEETNLLDVTPFGSRLRIRHPIELGRLLHLTLPMPRRLRCYDHDEAQYSVWSLVRHSKSLSAADEEPPHFEIGVAFIGKDCPATHETDPALRFEIAPAVSETDFWKLHEEPNADGPRPLASDRRTEERHSIADNVIIEIYDATGRVFARDEAQTENISRHGMAVFTKLNIVRGRYIRVRSAQYRIAIIAAVRRLVRVAGSNKNRLHLEFVDQQWPPL